MPLDSAVALVDALRLGHLLEPQQLAELTRDLAARSLEPRALAGELIRRGWLTPFQANQLLQGRGGELLLGSYVLMERLGEGGMGAVYKARNWKLGRVVALKVIRKERLASEDAVRRFHREIRAAAALSHPNIVMAYDADEVNGTHFFAMECVEGSDLAKLIKQHGPVPIPQACDWMRQAAVGLQHAHERGMVHRDIKPHNLLLTTQGAVKILDMGLARLAAEEGEASTTMTQEGMVMGTPDYMAPEQAEESHTVDIRADVYSLGCTLYQLLTGKVPFPGGTLIQKLKKHQSNQPAPIEMLRPDAPQAVCDIVYKLMAKRPEDRYQTPAEVAAALADCTIQQAAARDSRTLAASDPVRVVPATAETVNRAFDFQPTDEATEVVRAERRRSEKRRLLFAIGGGFVLLIGMAAAFVALYPRKGRRSQETSASTDEKAEKHWRPGPAKDVLPGLIARPARLRGIQRWQIETNLSRSGINSVAWSPDGKLLAYGDLGPGVRLVDARSRRLVRMLFGHESEVISLAWSPDGKWLASASSDKTVRLWRPDGTPGPVLKGHTAGVLSVAWSPDGKRLASGGSWGDSTVRLWSLEGTPGPILKHETFVQGLAAWSLDGKTLATADEAARKIRLWKAADGAPITTLGPLPRDVNFLSWSPDGKYLASNGGDPQKDKVEGWIWDIAERKQKMPLQDGTGHTGNWLAWSADGKFVFVTPDEQAVASLDPHTGGIARGIARIDSIFCCGMAYCSGNWSMNGPRLADCKGRIMKVADDGKLSASETPLRLGNIQVAWSPDGKSLAAAPGDKSVRLWMADGRPGPAIEGHEQNVSSIAWSPDGKRLASASYDKTIRIWKIDGSAGPILRGHEGAVTSVAWSPDGSTLASGGGDRTVHLWSKDGNAGPVLRGHEDGLTSVAWSPDGKWLASASGDKTVRLWRADGTPGPVLRGHTRGVPCVTWSPDGKRVTSSGDYLDATIRLWTVDGASASVLETGAERIDSVAWRPDGEEMAAALSKDRVQLWAADGSPGPLFKRHHGVISSVAWSPDGKHLASAAWDCTIQVSNARGEPELTIVVPPDGRSAAFSAAGELLYGDADAIEQELAYLVEQSDGRIEVLRPSAFLDRVKAEEKAAGR